MNWYKLTKDSFLLLHGPDHALPHRSRFEAISPSRFAHTATTAEIIVHGLVAAHNHCISITRYHGDGELVLDSGEARQIPDCHFGFECAGRFFNVLFEIDNSTEPLNSERLQSIRSKLRGYEAYQDSVWQGWKRAGEQGARPYFRVVFLTKFAERAMHILWLAVNVLGIRIDISVTPERSLRFCPNTTLCVSRCSTTITATGRVSSICIRRQRGGLTRFASRRLS